MENTTPVTGYKGFDKDLQCQKFQYEVGKTYTIEESPKLCNRGFHFCKSLTEVFSFYPHNGDNRYCEVEATGIIEHGSGKSVTNAIKIIRELTTEDICLHKEGLNLALIRKVSDNGGILCGSLALKLQGFDLGRDIKDLDFIFPNKTKALEVFEGYPICNSGSVNGDIDRQVAFFDKAHNKTYDIFIKDETYKEIEFYGAKIKVANYMSVWRAKLNFAFKGSIKHANDFKKFWNRLSFSIVLIDKYNNIDF